MIKLKELDNLKYFSIRLICQKLSGSIGDTCKKNVCVFLSGFVVVHTLLGLIKMAKHFEDGCYFVNLYVTECTDG